MGTNNSKCPPRMSVSASDARESSSDQEASQETHCQAVLAYLIRSGQLQIFTNDESDVDEKDEDLVGCNFYKPTQPPQEDPHPNTEELDQSDIKEEIMKSSGAAFRKDKTPKVLNMLQNRELGRNKKQQFTMEDQRTITCQYLPNQNATVADYGYKAFCGTYSKDGNIFLSASQDQNIRIFDTADDKFQLLKTIRARDVGWSILDTAFSPDGNYLIYSSWSDAIHLCNIHGDYDTHIPLQLMPRSHSFAIFSLTFSSDNTEILGGSNDGCLYVYDRESNRRTLQIDAHDDDVNAVAFADNSSQILFSGGDDGLVKIWDRRTLKESSPEPVGTFGGHFDGITYIDSKGDARYLISNSKDQTIKLWDVRKFSALDGVEVTWSKGKATKKAVAKQNWDYRWGQVPRSVSKKKKKIAGDSSIMTYRGHSILQTLIRCHFSPEHTTGQRYIYTGCATGDLIIYDLLTGKVVSRLKGHTSCTRDVSWHPYENIIMTSSWDGTVKKWQYRHQEDYREEEAGEESSESSESDDCSDTTKRRKCQRMTRQKQLSKRQMHCSEGGSGLTN
uniref:DDB1- and CUL4-associated factor 11-like isoform X1 n=1 Tax=Crassostrea virginica TaxID=6565 RepID=A0A8B8EXN5_CRAVI|nr:DDB1- and CUL4-associated factor 11-like isoform X1 [Crassostrea virginica]XP_022344746.1 DDB1- and CUL4-associated factor 11-like isoform X1 [Crassostrea virginica]